MGEREAAAEDEVRNRAFERIRRVVDEIGLADQIEADLRAEHVEVITEVMEFTEEEDAKFWPIYREYEAELARINDDRIALIKEYADNYATLTDATADRLATRALELEAQRQAVKASCYNRLKTVLSPRTAAKFLQVENQILLLLDLQIAASLPVVE